MMQPAPRGRAYPAPDAPPPGEAPGRVCICVLNWNAWRDTVECLESLLRLDHRDHQVVVVDNASEDGSADRLREWARGELEAENPAGGLLRSGDSLPAGRAVRMVEVDVDSVHAGNPAAATDAQVVLIESRVNDGFAAGMNLGIRYALGAGGFRYVWLLNNDTVVPPDSLTHLARRMAADPRIGICGSTLLYYDDPGRVQALGGFRHNAWLGVSAHLGQEERFDPATIDARATERRMHGVQGASMLVSLAMIRDVGLLSEDFFLYFEEHDWAIRARRKGFRLGYAARSLVYHKEGRSTGNHSHAIHQRSRSADFYLLQSRILFTRRHHPYALPSVYAGLLVTALNRLRRGQTDRLAMILRLAVRGLRVTRAERLPPDPPGGRHGDRGRDG